MLPLTTLVTITMNCSACVITVVEHVEDTILHMHGQQEGHGTVMMTGLFLVLDRLTLSTVTRIVCSTGRSPSLPCRGDTLRK